MPSPITVTDEELRGSHPLFRAIIENNRTIFNQYINDNPSKTVLLATTCKHKWSVLDVAAMYDRSEFLSRLLDKFPLGSKETLAIFRDVYLKDSKKVAEYLAREGDIRVTLPNGRNLAEAALLTLSLQDILLPEPSVIINLLLLKDITLADNPAGPFHKHTTVLMPSRVLDGVKAAEGQMGDFIPTAVRSNSINFILLYLIASGDPHYNHNPQAVNLLMIAAEEGHLVLVKLLMKFKADPLARETASCTAVHYATGKARETVVEYFFQSAPACRDLVGEQGDNLLNFALRFNPDPTQNTLSGQVSPSLIATLIRLRVDVNGENNFGLAPLNYACVQDLTEIGLMLIEAGADVEVFSGTSYLYQDLSYEEALKCIVNDTPPPVFPRVKKGPGYLLKLTDNNNDRLMAAVLDKHRTQLKSLTDAQRKEDPHKSLLRFNELVVCVYTAIEKGRFKILELLVDEQHSYLSSFELIGFISMMLGLLTTSPPRPISKVCLTKGISILLKKIFTLGLEINGCRVNDIHVESIDKLVQYLILLKFQFKKIIVGEIPFSHHRNPVFKFNIIILDSSYPEVITLDETQIFALVQRIVSKEQTLHEETEETEFDQLKDIIIEVDKNVGKIETLAKNLMSETANFRALGPSSRMTLAYDLSQEPSTKVSLLAVAANAQSNPVLDMLLVSRQPTKIKP